MLLRFSASDWLLIAREIATDLQSLDEYRDLRPVYTGDFLSQQLNAIFVVPKLQPAAILVQFGSVNVSTCLLLKQKLCAC